MKIMKKIFLFLCVAACFCACDEIEGPYIDENSYIPVMVDFDELDLGSVYRKVLIEDYTGHTCVNCPTGHAKLEELHGIYGDTLVAIGVHAGNFAVPTVEMPANFATEVGNQWCNDFEVQAFPSAIINRVKYGSYFFAQVSNWHNAILQVDRSKVYAAIQLVPSDDNDRLLANAKVTIMEDITDPVQLNVILIEDGIVSPQLTSSGIVPDYVHNHVLRASFNGPYGKQLTENGLVENGKAYTRAYALNWNPEWKRENCSLVAILLNMNTKEVLQVEKIDL